eukprot:347201-Chlamydomonas_euryale.AAC.2
MAYASRCKACKMVAHNMLGPGMLWVHRQARAGQAPMQGHTGLGYTLRIDPEPTLDVNQAHR